MPLPQPFNFDFDKEHGQKLIKVVQECTGCFCCNKPDPDKTCSRCHVNMYCNTQCQKTDWKASGIDAGNHKHTCQTYCENRAEENGVKGAIPTCLYSIDLIDEAMFVLSMRERSDLFLHEFGKYLRQQRERVYLTFQTSVVEILGERIRLAAAVTFMVDSEMRTVNYVLLETVDEGPDAMQHLYPRRGGPGSISTAAEAKVLEHLVAYIERLHECGNVAVGRLTYGRGLMHVADKTSFRARVDAANGRAILWLPDMRYSLGF
jgi:hypothetical protein